MALSDLPEVAVLGSRPVVRVPIDQIQVGESARLGERSSAHITVVAELAGGWEPLLVTPAGRIVDGQYRYLAACRLGLTHLECVIFDGDDRSAFVEGVRRNVAHGLPLTLQERKNAATRILAFGTNWSDRKIAELCGLAHKTVGRLRQGAACPGGAIPHLDKRKGRDGKYQAPDTNQARARIVEAIESDPGASLRQVARCAGSSPETVRKVRRQLEQGSRPPATPQPTTISVPNQVVKPRVSPWRDAAFVSTDGGSSFAAWFERTSISSEWLDHVQSVPLSRVYEIADEALRRASEWKSFADALTLRANRNGQ
jgi:ParB-like chromosome segregation protein Spo0J